MNELIEELKRWLDTQSITSGNIGNIRRQCFVPWDSKWNGIVRDETAIREKKVEDPVKESTVEGTLKAFKILVDKMPGLETLYTKSGGVPIKKKYTDEIKERQS